MEYERVKKQIAEMFRIARVEGALRKAANGEDDAEEILSLVEIKSDDQSLPESYKFGELTLWVKPSILEFIKQEGLIKVIPKPKGNDKEKMR